MSIWLSGVTYQEETCHLLKAITEKISHMYCTIASNTYMMCQQKFSIVNPMMIIMTVYALYVLAQESDIQWTLFSLSCDESQLTW